MTGLIELILVLALIGVILWAVTTLVPMPPVWRNLILAIVIVIVLLWLISYVGGGSLKLHFG